MLYELTGLKKVLGGRNILDIQQISIRSGLVYSLTGPNGAGKTTLLKILAFLDRPSAGEIRFGTNKVVQVEGELLDLRRQVVMVDQSPLLFTGTVADNVEFGLKMRKIPAPERKKRVIEALGQVGMEQFVQAEAHRLSGGETKRVALARALAIRPKVLLCDEPTANIDSENQKIILDILAGINRQEKTSIIFSTHYHSLEQQLAHSCLHLQHGHISESQGDNVFQAELIERAEERSFYRLADRMNISLPNQAVPDALVINLIIDQEKILFVRENGCNQTGSLVEGRVLHTGEDRERIRVDIDTGIPLHFFLSHDAYRQICLLVGQRIAILIPDVAIHCVSNGVAGSI